jgi:hypothetical protein
MSGLPYHRRSLIAVAAFVTCLLAAAWQGIDVPATATVGGTRLVLNGMGVRTATVLKLRIYVMSLYLEQRCSDPDSIVQSTGRRRVWQYYFRDVGVGMIQRGWADNLAAHNASLAGIESECAAFARQWEAVRGGTVVTIDFSGDTVIVAFDGRPKQPVVSAAFRRALLNVWLGPKVTEVELKKALLGGRAD